MGRTPPSTLLRPIRFAPKKKGRAGMGTLPEMTLLVKQVKEDRRLEEFNPRLGDMRSFRCCGRRPSCPPAEPEGKE
jgi:hypothetical protein